MYIQKEISLQWDNLIQCTL